LEKSSKSLYSALQDYFKNAFALAAQQREWGTSFQPLKKPTANGNKYSSAA
jgi:hypothetical protein